MKFELGQQISFSVFVKKKNDILFSYSLHLRFSSFAIMDEKERKKFEVLLFVLREPFSYVKIKFVWTLQNSPAIPQKTKRIQMQLKLEKEVNQKN